MNYFDYLRLTGKEDKKDNYIEFLINFADYDKELAEYTAKIMFQEE